MKQKKQGSAHLLEDNLFNIRKLPSSIRDTLSRYLLNRIGKEKTSFFITKDIIGHVSPGKLFQLAKVNPKKIDGALYTEKYKGSDISVIEAKPDKNLLKQAKAKNKKFVSAFLKKEDKTTPPPYALLKGKWNHTLINSGAGNNVFGGMSTFVDEKNTTVSVPVVTATNENLAFYGAYLVAVNDTLVFDCEKKMGITVIELGKTYVSGYLMQKKFSDGLSMEYHNAPHLWVPTTPKSKGYIILGRHVNGTYYTTGFEIPYGYAVYASPFVIHTDEFLVGEFLLVFTDPSEVSAVELRNKKGGKLILTSHKA